MELSLIASPGALDRSVPLARLRKRLFATAVARIRGNHALAALLLYVAVAAALENNAIGHLDSVCACGFGTDPTQYMWAMEWWPYAIVHGLNPFVTHEIWTNPSGFNLAAATATPAAALVAAPITALAGPLVAFNIVATLAPAIAAWFAYRLCLYVTRAPAASVLGGYLFGFSSYELGQMLGHLHLTITFAIPAAALLTLERLDGAISRHRYMILTALVLSVQLLISSEVLLTLTCMGIAALACGLVLCAAGDRRRILRLLPELTGAYALMALVCSPYLYYELRGQAVAAGVGSPADSLEFFIPTVIMRVGGHRFSAVSVAFPGNPSEQGAYLGLPLIAIVAAFALQSWRKRSTKILVAILAVAVLWSLGDHLYVDGHPTIPLPWALLRHLPLFDQLLPVRIAVFVSLMCSVIVALWLSAPGFSAARRWLVAALAVAVLIPNIGGAYLGTRLPIYHTTEYEPAFFTTDLYRRYLRPGEVVLPLPYGTAPYGLSLLWQARTGMYFRLASGSFGYSPTSYFVSIAGEMEGSPLTTTAPADLRLFMVQHQVSDVVADPSHSGPWLDVLAKLGLRPVRVGGVFLYRVPVVWGAQRG